MRIADAVAKYLELREIKHVFGIGAGTVSATYDAFHDTDIEVYTTRNEAGATYSATRYASMTKNLGVCVLAGGVGINNAINGIADAMRTKSPVLVISGYVNRWQIGKGAVQELNTEPITESITKYSKTVFEEDQVLPELKKAIDIALTPPHGPVHISVPIDVQIAPFNDSLDHYKVEKQDLDAITYDKDALVKAISLINESKTGLIMVGKGARGLGQPIQDLASKLHWSIVTTPEGKGVISSEFKYNLGNYGFCSSEAAQAFVEQGDFQCVLVLGSSLGESATRNFNDVLIKNKKLIHIDYDLTTLNKVFHAKVPVHYALEEALTIMNREILCKEDTFIPPTRINEPYEKNHTGLSTRLFLENIVDLMPSSTTFISDIGEYMNFVYRYLPLKEGMDFETSLNYGAMGSGIAGAMGAYLTDKNRKYAVIVGDGSFWMNGTEVITAKEYNMPIVYFVINNAMYGYVVHGHQFIYKREPMRHTTDRISIKDLGNVLGVKSVSITSIEQLGTLRQDLQNLTEPMIVELITDGSERIPAADRFKTLSNER